MNPARLLVLLVSLPLLLGGFSKKSIADEKAVKKQKHDVIDENSKKLSSEEINQLKKAIKILEGHDVTLEQMVSEWLESKKVKGSQVIGLDKEIVVDEKKLVERLGVKYPINSETPFTGTSIKYYPNGQKRSEYRYKDGIREGLTVVFHENGQKWKEINHTNGLADGVYIEWYDNGQMWVRREFASGMIHGFTETWYSTGEKASESNWVNDKEMDDEWKYYFNKKGEVVDENEHKKELLKDYELMDRLKSLEKLSN